MGYKAVINDPSYLCHFNKNHDPKNGRFTFKKAWETIDTAVGKGYDAVEKVAKGAYKGIKKEFKDPSSSDFDGYSAPKISAKKTPEQHSNYEYLKESPSYTSTYDIAKELSRKFSPEYQERFQKKVESIDNRIDLSKLTSKELDNYLGLNSEIDRLLGEYGNEVYDKRMQETYADLLRRSEFDRLFSAVESKLLNAPLSHSLDISEDSLTHYNKNHSKANGQFTSGDGDGDGISDDHHNQSKFLNKDGSLTKYAKDVSGLSSINMKPRKDVNYKKAQKLISKDVRKVEFWSGSQSLEDEAAEYFAEKKLEKDIERANKDKDFMDALRKGVAKYFEIEKDDWSKAYDYEDQLLDELKKKYPQHKDVISGITIGENVYSGNYKKWLKTDNAFSDILNNDFYYEQSDLDSVSLKSIDDIISAYDRELANTMIQKYGSYNVDSAWKEKVGLK